MKKLLVVLVVVLLLAAFAGTLGFLASEAREPDVVHETATPFVTTITRKTVATGSVVPRKEVDVKPQVSGILDAVLVEPGDLVEKGDMVARIRIVPDLVRLNEAENRLQRARIALTDTRRDLERSRRLFQEKTISESILQQSEVSFEQAAQELAAAEENLELLREGSTARSGAIASTNVRSTMSGMVLEVPVEVGDSVIETNNFNDGTTIATVADMDELIFEGKVDESEVGKLRAGMPLEVTIGALQDETFSASLEHVAPKGVDENGTVRFEIRAALVPKDGVFIRANYSATADIVLDRREDVLAIDEGLLQFDEDDEPFVEVETAPQQFEPREVELGISDGINIEVISGLSPEDRVKKPRPLLDAEA